MSSLLRLPALLCIVYLAGCARPKDLEYVDFRNIKVLQMGLQESKVGMDVRFYNPNNRRAQLKDARVDVFINDKFLGKTDVDSTISIPKRDTFTIPVVLRIETLSAATSAIQSLGDTSALIRLEGSAKVGKGGVFKNFPIKYEGRRKIQL